MGWFTRKRAGKSSASTTAGGNATGASMKKDGPSDFDPNPPPLPELRTTIEICACPDKTDASPPAYTDSSFGASILQAIASAYASHWLNGVPTRHISLYVDDNCRLDKEIMDAIQLIAAVIIQICRAFDSDANLFFTSQRNKDDDNLSPAMLDEANFLDNLFLSKKWYPALKFVREADDKMENRSIARLVSSVRRWMDGEEATDNTSGDKHVHLLDYLRERMIAYWSGWSFAETSCQEFMDHYKEALKRVREQPKLLNSLAFTIRNEIARQKRLYTAKQSTPTTCIIITASELQPSETRALKEQLKSISGGAAEFAIQAVVVTKKAKDSSLTAHNDLDNATQGDKDVYDVTNVVAGDVLQKGLSALFLGKIFNSHLAEWDSKNLGPKQYVGESQLSGGLGKYVIPALDLIRERVGRAPL